MPRPDLVDRLAAIEARGACPAAERRASLLLRDELRARGAPARVEPLWVRPQWPAAWALHGALGVIGTLLSVGVPVAGLAVLAATLVSFFLDATAPAHLLRALFPRRATQLVVSALPPQDRIRLVITASIDAPRTGALFAPGYARLRPPFPPRSRPPPRLRPRRDGGRPGRADRPGDRASGRRRRPGHRRRPA